MSKKRKIKPKKKGLLVIFCLLFLVMGGLCFLMINPLTYSIEDVKKHYNQYAVTIKNAALYDEKKKKVGSIKKGFIMELEKLGEHKTKYFQIKDSDYYVLFKDVNKSKEKPHFSDTSHYLVFNQNIKTNKTVHLYQDKKNVITLQEINAPVEYQDDNYYYISFLKDIFAVQKKEIKNLVDVENTKEKAAEAIQYLSYTNIDDNCSGYDCVSTRTVKEQIQSLKDNGYTMISKDDYQRFVDNNIRLRDKSIVLGIQKENDFSKKLAEETKVSIDEIPYQDSHKNVHKYDVKSYTTIDNLLKMAAGEDVLENPPVIDNQGIAVLNYHFFYDSSNEACNESICLDVSKFREHLNYLKENNYKTLTMNEFKRWMYGEIELPEKSVLLTIDDGAFGTGKHNGNKLIPLLEEYQLNATLFLIAGWWDIENYRSPYLDIQSHTFDMHQYGSCGKGQINCATLEEAKTDLKKSLEIIGNDDSFCFPFYAYSDTSLQAVKETGFKISFVGGSRKATRKSDKFLIPRYPIYDNITLQQFINMVN